MSTKLLKQIGIIGALVLSGTLLANPLPTEKSAWLSDNELSDITGQALFNLQKIAGDGGSNGQAGLTFTRLSMGASIDVNANIDRIILGNYDIPWTSDDSSWNAKHLAADIDFQDVSLGCLDDSRCTDPNGNALPHFHLEDPYIEFAYKGDGTSARQLVGVRIGFDNASGWLSGTINALSGDLEGTCVNILCGGGLFTGSIHEPRQNTLTIAGIGIPLSGLHHLPVGTASFCGTFTQYACGPTRNLYFGFQTESLDYPKLGSGTQGTAKPGFWINMQDNVKLSSGDIYTALFGGFYLPPYDNCRGSGGSAPCRM